MKFPPLHQSDLSTRLFGLLEGRFLYRIPGGAGSNPEARGSSSSDATDEHYVPEGEVGRTKREAREAREDEAMNLLDTEDAYNARYGDEAKKYQEDVYYESVHVDFDDLPGSKRKIIAIQEALARKRGSAANLENDKQYQILKNMMLIIDKLDRMPAQGRELILRAHRARLSRRHEQMADAGERKELWAKRPAYDELNDIFEDLSKTREFKDVWGAPDGLAGQHQREAKELFIAILAEKTNGFQNGFVLGDDFGNTPEENIRNYPFIYREFYKHEGAPLIKQGVTLEAIDQATVAASEASKKLEDVASAEAIIAANSDAGLTPSDLGPRPSMPDTNAWKKRKGVLENMRRKLVDAASRSSDDQQKSGWESAAQSLKLHEEEADRYTHLSSLKDRERIIQEKFTRKELNTPTRRKLIMSLAMKKFMKAMEEVDRPHKGTNWLYTLHPTVRRMLIASVYENGVATYERDSEGLLQYNDKLSKERTWMLSNLALSNYFNMKEEGENMDPGHSIILRAAYLSSRISLLLEQTKDVEGLLMLVEQGARVAPSEYAKYPKEYVDKYSHYTTDQASHTLAVLRADRERLQRFMNRTQEAIRNPYSAESNKFIEEIRNGDYAGDISAEIDRLGKLGVIDGATLAAFEKQMYHLQINFKTAELQDQNSLMFFEGLGMHIEGVYPAYLEAIKKNPQLKTEYWHKLLLGSDAEFKQLMDFFDEILPNSDAGGKQDFIASMILLRRKYKGKRELPEATFTDGDEDARALTVFQMLKLHLSGRAETAAMSDMRAKEIDAKKGGMHVGDIVSKHVEGVWDMLTGPGQSIANRAAGFVLLYGAYKAARSAMKGDTKGGKVMRALFVAAAVEIGMKNLTGRGVLDRLGLDMLEDATEGTYEAVLVKDAREDMEQKKITKQAHESALFALNDVPFSDVMDWYDHSDPNGMPLNKGNKDRLPSGLRSKLSEIARLQGAGMDIVDKDMVARRVLYETVRHFFGYVGKKENNEGHDKAKESLRERWITMVDHPDMETKESLYDHREFLKRSGLGHKGITWKMVMRAEIPDSAVQATVGDTLAGRVKAGAEEGIEASMEWLTEYVYNPGSGAAEEFLRDLGDGSQKAKEFFADVYEWSGQKLYFGKEKVIMWYGEHQFEIKRGLENHWDLVVTSVKLPFKIIYGVDNWAIPWSLAKLKQVEQILQSSKAETIERPLNESDIASQPQFIGSTNPEVNPEFRFFGLTQRGFMEAFRQNDVYEDAGHIGYYVSRTTPEAAGVNWGSDSLDDAWSKMAIASRKEAERRFIDTGHLKQKDVEDFMYPIHTIKKTTDPKELNVFWRMPLHGSAELDLLATGDLADFRDPNKRKDRDIFKVDPDQSTWANLRDAFALDMGSSRVFFSTAGKYAAQVPAFIYWNAEKAGEIIKAVGKAVIHGKNEKKNEEDFEGAIDSISVRSPEHQQFIDEAFTSAGDQNLAISDFYKKPINAKLYKFSLDFAQQKGHPLYLGLFEDNTEHVGKMYMDHSNKRKYYQQLRQYYNDFYVAAGKADKDIDDAISVQAVKYP